MAVDSGDQHSAFVLRIGRVNTGWAQLDELRHAVLLCRKAGKRARAKSREQRADRARRRKRREARREAEERPVKKARKARKREKPGTEETQAIRSRKPRTAGPTAFAASSPDW